jgi:hypothetical protein
MIPLNAAKPGMRVRLDRSHKKSVCKDGEIASPEDREFVAKHKESVGTIHSILLLQEEIFVSWDGFKGVEVAYPVELEEVF